MTKADAMAFAIEHAAGDLGKADTMYRMFVDNMELPDTETTAADSAFKKPTEATEMLRQRIMDRISTQPRIILPGMPGLEWMTENLTGFGGTEIDGRWYYTYDEAEEAVKQLGEGWRLPIDDEFVQLDELGSTWDAERKGRWFGGNHGTDHEGSLFLPAAGYRRNSTGALTNVGTDGYYWSSSSYAAGYVGAGGLSFGSGDVNPLSGGYRAYGFPVRCVRNVK